MDRVGTRLACVLLACLLLAHPALACQDVTWSQYLLRQNDARWANHRYREGRCYTLRSQGCFITALAMAQRILDIDPHATPVTVDEGAGYGGYAGCLFGWHAVRQAGMQIRYAWSAAAARKHLDAGGLALVQVSASGRMHFVLAVEHNGQDFYVLDPLGRIGWLSRMYAIRSFRLLDRNPGGAR